MSAVNSIVREKSNTYVVDLKPAANEPLVFLMRDYSTPQRRQSRDEIHHGTPCQEYEDKEDIFICV